MCACVGVEKRGGRRADCSNHPGTGGTRIEGEFHPTRCDSFDNSCLRRPPPASLGPFLPPIPSSVRKLRFQRPITLHLSDFLLLRDARGSSIREHPGETTLCTALPSCATLLLLLPSTPESVFALLCKTYYCINLVKYHRGRVTYRDKYAY